MKNLFEVVKFNFSDDLELLKINLDDRDMSVNISIENLGDAMLELGLISEIDEENGVVVIEKEVLNYGVDEWGCEEEEMDLFDYVGDLSLENVKRVVDVFFKNDCYRGVVVNDLPF